MDSKKEWLRKIAMNDFVQIGEHIYFFALNFNALYRMKLEDKEPEYLGSVPDEKLYGRHLYGAITECDGKIFLPPVCAKEIAIYDIASGSFEKIALQYDATGVYSKFFGAICAERKICFIPARYQYLVIMDLENNKTVYLDNWRTMLDVPAQYTKLYVKNGFFIKNGKLYMASQIGDCVIKISLDSYEAEVVCVGNGTDGFMDMCADEDGKHIWFVHRTHSEIYKWNEENGEIVVYSDFPTGFTNKDQPFINLLSNKTHICAVAYQANMSIEINKKTGEIREALWDTVPKESMFNEWHAKHYFGKMLQDERWLLVNIDDHSFDIVSNSVIEDTFYIEDDNSEVRLLFGVNHIQVERKDYGLEKYLKVVKGGI